MILTPCHQNLPTYVSPSYPPLWAHRLLTLMICYPACSPYMLTLCDSRHTIPLITVTTSLLQNAETYIHSDNYIQILAETYIKPKGVQKSDVSLLRMQLHVSAQLANHTLTHYHLGPHPSPVVDNDLPRLQLLVFHHGHLIHVIPPYSSICSSYMLTPLGTL